MRRHSKRPSRSFYRIPLVTDDLPFDILPIILQALSTRQDYLACTLVNRTFNKIATPLLYRELNSRAIPEVNTALRLALLATSREWFRFFSHKIYGGQLTEFFHFHLHLQSPLHHPASTIIKRPELAKYVRRVTETGSVHRSLCARFPTMTGDILRALSLYTNLISFAWIDDSVETDNTLLSLIQVIRDHEHPLRELTIRTLSDLGTEVWSKLNTLTGLHSISLWCMEGPPRVLQGWSEPLGSTLSHLELGVSVFPYPPAEFLSHLPLLTNLRLKGAPATSIPTILTCLPNLQILDTEYLPSFRTAQVPPPTRMPTLKSLIVRTNIVDTVGPGKLWTWIKDIVPNPGLEKLKLHAFTMNNSGYICTGAAGKMSSGGTMVSEMFLMHLAKLHGNWMREFDIGGVELTMSDIRYLKTSFAKLELLACAVAVPDVSAIQLMISGARNLHTLKLNVFWIPYTSHAINVGKEVLLPNASLAYIEYQKETPFTLEHAISLMLTTENPKLKTIAIGKHLFNGQWILVEGENERGIPKFEVAASVAEDTWIS